ncbi:MAG: hypothetical protein UW41_C0003G0029 [Candidatus Collierbacteria bacterium GW2011_GWC2_44_18]|uniref:Uncharacterized protein n=2 Tax=Microgenomates group TaxID=1794810 RepID=A0A0G1M5S8_9BACT|nr:MAG: hypothetical protein UW16_C0006G0026 [Microgenomates group bacterium GW2011_GWC1_44_10]KKT49662.1 MAG: hypothetical protein UW41_C0003G0029 [Candidatus Collierbacteria bacterium GW2011_GWC2_44_18]KKT67269.1 MAG: hypothetical protein UW60_C0010G0032 [Candidatus Woesebacteria bacterium GW2011_GWA2_44_33]
MKKPIGKIIDYLALSLLVSTAILLTLILNGNKTYQMITAIYVSLVYVIWGIFHHWREKTIHQKVILEYVLFGVLGCVLAIGLL